MNTYEDIGFSNTLLREVSLNSFEYNPVKLEAFTSEIEGSLVGRGVSADVVTTGEMSFDRARGGSLVLGGEENRNGVFSLLDELNIERISMDKDGITINDGKITIKDVENQTIIDSIGLISAANFPSNLSNNFYSPSKTTTSTSYVAVPGATMPTFTTPRDARAFVYMRIQAQNPDHITNFNYQMRTAIFNRGENILESLLHGEYIAATNGTTIVDETNFVGGLITLGGNVEQSMEVRFKAEGGGTAQLTQLDWGYIVFGT